jgi:hypothetical protein
MNLIVSFSIIFLITTTFSTILELEATSSCSDKPKLFLHQKTSVREIIEKEENFVNLKDGFVISCQASRNVEWTYEGNGVCLKYDYVHAYIST